MCAAVQVLPVTESPAVIVSPVARLLTPARRTATARGQWTALARAVPVCHISCSMFWATKCPLCLRNRAATAVRSLEPEESALTILIVGSRG